jgi:hypothetical protein
MLARQPRPINFHTNCPDAKNHIDSNNLLVALGDAAPFCRSFDCGWSHSRHNVSDRAAHSPTIHDPITETRSLNSSAASCIQFNA